MPEFAVEVSAGYEHLNELCSMYWATDETGSFTYTVKALADRFGHASHKLSKLVSEACCARSLSAQCELCDRGFPFRTRSEAASFNGRYAETVCSECRERQRAQEERERARANAAKQAEVAERYAVRSGEKAVKAGELDLPLAMALAALVEDAEEVSEGVIAPVANRVDRLTPSSDYDFEMLERLIGAGILHVHPTSPADAFVWSEDGTLTGSFYPTLTSYYIAGDGDLGKRIKDYLASVVAIISRETWPERWAGQLYDFWFDVAAAECKAYLVHKLGEHRLPFKPGQKTDDVIRRALGWYSIGQVFYFIYRAARDSAAYYAREKITAKQAANSAVTRIAADIERAYAQGWDVSVYRRDSRLPASTLSHIVFGRALKVDDPMSYSPLSLPVRRAGLELDWQKIDAEAFERLIFQLVAETGGYENVDWLMHTNAPDHGRDISAVRLRRDPLSGHSSQRVVIQCKHWLSKAIRDIDMQHALVSIEHWQDPPFDVLVMATSGRLTADAVTWIERHNAKGVRPGIELWNDAHLEVLLSERPHLIRAFELR